MPPAGLPHGHASYKEPEFVRISWLVESKKKDADLEDPRILRKIAHGKAKYWVSR
jgi:hypothetical protein